ncbi:MAG TPA: nicotinamide riboside transporter PnuC [Ramlibacter sp.]|nr:nicotinamide riboside transporter PnuC [Ramlibacter sp.]
MTGWIELSANGVTAVSIALAGRNNIHTWWTGMVGCVLFAVTFFRAALYADVALQGFFIVTSLAGWWQWMRGKQGAALPVSHAGQRQLAAAVAIAVAATLAYGALLQRFTDAYAPFVDSAVLAFSIVAQVFLMRRRIETWPVWLLVNSIAVPLYASRGLYLTAVLHAAYWINAWVAWRRWRRLAVAGAPA